MKVKLGDICEINPRTPIETSLERISFIPMQNVGEHGELDASLYITPPEAQKKGYCSFMEGDVLLAKITPCLENGKGALVKNLYGGKGVGSTEFHVLRPKDEIVHRQWLYFYTVSPTFRKACQKNMTGSGGQKRVPKQYLRHYEISLPSLSEQNSQAATLMRLRDQISDRRAQLLKLDELVKARFVEMFGDLVINTKGYTVRALSEIAQYWNGLTYAPNDVANDGVIVLRSSNIQNSALDFSNTIRVSCKIGEKKYVNENDILMCSRNGSAKLVGKVALIPSIKEPMAFGAFMMIIRSPQYYPYLQVFFQTHAFRRQIATGATTTINQITGNMLDLVKLPIPPVYEVGAFASFVREVDKSKVVVQLSQKRIDVLHLLW